MAGSGGETICETVASLNARGERVGVVQVRLYRPFPAQAFIDALPATARSVAVLDRTKEPDSRGLAEQAVDQRWNVYEEMATRGAQQFAADARKDH